MGPAHGIALLDNRANDLVEDSVNAAMGGDDFKLAAPGGDRFGHAVEESLVWVEGEFIEDDMAAFAGEGVGIGGERVDAPAIVVFEDVGAGVSLAVDEDFTE